MPGVGPAAARLKENMGLGARLLFDRDAAGGMPDELADLDFEGWCSAVDLLFPGFAACGKVWQPSTSTRVLVDGQPLASLSWHVYVRVTDPVDIPGAWAWAYERSAITTCQPRPWDDEVLLAFGKPRRSRATGLVIGKQLWSIYDRTTWATNRLVFEGCPTVDGPGLTIAPPAVAVFEGPPLDLSQVKPPSLREKKAIREAIAAITGHAHRPERTYHVVKGRRVVAGTLYVIPDLSMDLDVEAAAGATTVGEFAASDDQHLRIQSPYRDSSSWAAYLGRHKDGSPFLFDSGTGEKHVLDDEAKLAAAKALLDRLRDEGADGPAFCVSAAISAAACLKVREMASFTELKGHLRTRKTRVLSDWAPAVTAAAARLLPSRRKPTTRWSWSPSGSRAGGRRLYPDARSYAATTRSSSAW